MDSTSAGSFIPRSPMHDKAPKPVRRVYLLSYLSLVLLFGALIAAAGVYGYNVFLHRKLQTAQTTLDQQRNRFNASDLIHIQAEAARLRLTKQLLDQHAFPYTIFAALERSTVQTVQLSKFSFKSASSDNTNGANGGNTGGPGMNNMGMGSGQAPVTSTASSYTFSVVATATNLNDLLFQRQTYQADPLFTGATFSKITYGDSSSNGSQTTTGTKSQSTAPQVSFTMTKTFTAADLPFDPSLYAAATSTSESNTVMTSTTTVPVTTPTTTVSSSTATSTGA